MLYRTAGYAGGHVSLVRRRVEGGFEFGRADDGVSDSMNPEHMDWSMLIAGNGIATSLGTRWLDCHGPVRDRPNAIEHSVQVRAAHSRGRVARDPQVCGSAPRGLPLDR